MNCTLKNLVVAFVCSLGICQACVADEPASGTLSTSPAIPAGEPGHRAHIKPFFETYCIQCHGPETSKGKLTLHTLNGDLASGTDGALERWEDILDVLKRGEMPPEDEEQPSDAEREAITHWIDQGLRDHVAKTGHAKTGSSAESVGGVMRFVRGSAPSP